MAPFDVPYASRVIFIILQNILELWLTLKRYWFKDPLLIHIIYSTTVQPTCTVIQRDCTANHGVMHSTDDISLPFFRVLTRLFCQLFYKKIKNVDKTKNVKNLKTWPK